MKELNSGSHDLSRWLDEPHSVVLEFSEVDGEPAWIAKIPELRGCMNVGATQEEALSGLRGAKEAWIRHRLERGETVPPARKTSHYSGRLVVRMGSSLHERSAQFAQMEGISLNQFIVEAIANAVGQRESASYPQFTTLMKQARAKAPIHEKWLAKELFDLLKVAQNE